MTSTEDTQTTLEQRADKIIIRRTLYAAGAGFIPIPIVDAAALLGIQVTMIRDIAKVYEVEFKEERVKTIITTLVGDVAAVGLFKIIPGLGTVLGGASAAAGGAAATYALGKVFSKHFREGGTLLSFDAAKSKEFFRREFEKGKEVVGNLKKKATNPKADKAEVNYADLLERNKALHVEILELQQQLAALEKQSPVDLTNLKIIEGIGPKTETALKAGGIENLEQLAQSAPEHIKSVLDSAEGKFNFSVTNTWGQQAQLVVDGDLEGLKVLQEKLLGGK